ncbi:9326_t:CDS:2 [Ambispora leptoticha]|uniref:9326_t:CDS:1 n=1 Tax=Ambispora leptoticha TaxID=144679 RepID=A0A9N9C2U7_9GLOM|nr:9326_t:CDS:2 [Ambispora leptoticha]
MVSFRNNETKFLTIVLCHFGLYLLDLHLFKLSRAELLLDSVLYFLIFISAVVTIWTKTISNALVFCLINVAPLMETLFQRIFFSRICSLSEIHPCDESKRINALNIRIYYLSIVEFLSTSLIIQLAKQNQWTFIPKFKYTRLPAIKRLYRIYAYQLPLIHGSVVFLTIFFHSYWMFRMNLASWMTSFGFRRSLDSELYSFFNPYNMIILIVYLSLPIVAVRRESHWMTFISYLANIYYGSSVLYKLFTWCIMGIRLPRVQGPVCFVKNQIVYDPFFQVLLMLGILAIFFVILLMLNTIRCHKNYGKNLGFYLRYRSVSSSFEFSGDPSFEKSSTEKYV